MPSQAEPLLCHRCHRPVETSRDQFAVFEHMHVSVRIIGRRDPLLGARIVGLMDAFQ